MKNENKYHIDVTPEEDALFNSVVADSKNESRVPISFGKVFWAVLGVHAVIGTAIVATSSSAEATPSKAVDLTQPVAEIPKQYQEIKKTNPSPTPTPTPQQTVTQPTQTIPSNNSKYTKEYTVKQGDTLYSIAKKYKLNTERLIKINNIKDANKLVVGQKLKFM